MAAKLNMKNNLYILMKMIRYNLKIIFANRFIWFLIASLGFFLFFAIQQVLENRGLGEDTVYVLVIFPGVLLIFRYFVSNTMMIRVCWRFCSEFRITVTKYGSFA